MALTKRPLFDPPIVRRAVRDAFAKTVNLRHMVRNPVMFVVLVGSVLTTVVLLGDIARGGADLGFTLQLALWLWFTVVFANFAEAMAEGRGKAQAESLRRSRTLTSAKRLTDPKSRTSFEAVPADHELFDSEAEQYFAPPPTAWYRAGVLVHPVVPSTGTT